MHAHDGPVRSLSIGPSGEVVSGCQSDNPNLRRWLFTSENLEEIGTMVYHDHWVVALSRLDPLSGREFYPNVSFDYLFDDTLYLFRP